MATGPAWNVYRVALWSLVGLVALALVAIQAYDVLAGMAVSVDNTQILLFAIVALALWCGISGTRGIRLVLAHPDRHSRVTIWSVTAIKWTLALCGAVVIVAKAKEEIDTGRPAIGLGLTTAVVLATVKGVLGAIAKFRDDS